jgi:hypothetical protein
MEAASSSIFDDILPTPIASYDPITAVLTLSASLTSSAYEAISTAFNGTFPEVSNGTFPDYPGEGNSTSPFDPSAGEIHEGSYILVRAP